MDCSLSTPQGAVKGETIFQNIKSIVNVLVNYIVEITYVFRDVKDFASSLNSTNL